jgi:hypothetical protein
MDEMMEEYGEEDLYALADDNNYYANLSFELLEKLNVKTVNIQSGIIKLIGEQNKENWTLDMSKKDAPGWNLIFFNINRHPVIISTVELTERKIKEYFNIADE